MEMVVNISGFIKIGSKDNILDLYENGTVYCNTIQRFKEMDEADGRGDSFEGISFLRNISNIKRIELQVKDKSKPPIRLNTNGVLQIKDFYENLRCNLYCLYFISTDAV